MKIFCSALLGNDKDYQLEKNGKNSYKNNDIKYKKNCQYSSQKSNQSILNKDILSMHHKNRNYNQNLFFKLMKEENPIFDFDTKSSILEIIDYPITKSNELIEKKKNLIIPDTGKYRGEVKGDNDSDIELNEKDFEINTEKNVIIPHTKIRKNNVNKKSKKFISKSPGMESRKSVKNKIIENLNINQYDKNKSNLDSNSKVSKIHLGKKSNIIFNTNKKNQSKEKSRKINISKYSSNFCFKKKEKHNNNIKYNNCLSTFGILNGTKENNNNENMKSAKILESGKDSISIYFLRDKKIYKKENIFFRTSHKSNKMLKLNNPFENLINNPNLLERKKKYLKKKIMAVEGNSLKSNKNFNNSNIKSKNINRANGIFIKDNNGRLNFPSPKSRKGVSFC